MFRAVEYCPGSVNPCGFLKFDDVPPNCRIFAFILSANAAELPALSLAKAFATSFALLINTAFSRFRLVYLCPAPSPNRVGSTCASVD
jgi:hypothetical protein